MTSLSAKLDSVLTAAYQSGVFTTGGYILLVNGSCTQGFWSNSFQTDSASEVMFDSASMTKVLATWPLLIDSLNREELTLLSRVEDVFSGCAGETGASLTVADLATHSAGLKQETRLDKYLDDLTQIERVIISEQLDRHPGRLAKYGNRAFILLGRMLEQVSGSNLRDLFSDRVQANFSMQQASYGCESGLVVPMIRAYSGEVVVGRPHDRNAELLGGAAGHAGLFVSLDDLRHYGTALLAMKNSSQAPWLDFSLLPWYREGTDRYRGLAWCLTRRPGLTRHIAYHHGFTGGTVVFEPADGLFVGILTDSVNVQERHPGLTEMREEVLELALRN